MLDRYESVIVEYRMPPEMMTAEDAADFLSLNVKKIYQLANEGRIPATRISGKWVFPRSLIEEWIYESARRNLKGGLDIREGILIVIGSNDFVWEILSSELIKTPYHLVTPYASVGSTEGLVALSNRIAHIAGVHLFDPETQQYNTPYLSRYLPGTEVSVINLFYRNQGLIFRKGNPKNIAGISDLMRDDVSIINRQEGSGTRVLLDHFLKTYRLTPDSVKGYSNAVNTHLDVAMSIKSGAADAGLGIQAAAKALDLGFLPLKNEQYDIVMLKEHLNLRCSQALLRIIQSDRFKNLLNGFEGYDLRDSGRCIWEGKVH